MQTFVHTQLFGQLGLGGRRGQVYADVRGHLHSVRKPCCYLGGPHPCVGQCWSEWSAVN